MRKWCFQWVLDYLSNSLSVSGGASLLYKTGQRSALVAAKIVISRCHRYLRQNGSPDGGTDAKHIVK